jgi:hypothetical protein
VTHRRNQKYKARRRKRVALARLQKLLADSELGYYDRRGRPITAWRWHQLLAARHYRVVQQTEVGPILVSTVWLGLDHGFFQGDPIIFETMMFRGETPRALDYQERYCSLAAAQLGHASAVARLSLLGPVRICHEPD